MAEFGETLSKQVGPLPVGVWVAVVGGGLGIAYVIRKRTAGAATKTVNNSQAPPIITGGAVELGSNAAVTPGVPAPQDDNAWSQLAISTLNSRGYFAAADVQRALSDFLNGAPLSQYEMGIVNEAILLVGPPPIAPPTANNKPPDTPKDIKPIPTTLSEPEKLRRMQSTIEDTWQGTLKIFGPGVAHNQWSGIVTELQVRAPQLSLAQIFGRDAQAIQQYLYTSGSQGMLDPNGRKPLTIDWNAVLPEGTRIFAPFIIPHTDVTNTGRTVTGKQS